jgi:hypothetical protein
MDPERWNHVDRLLQSALDRPATERDVFLRSACVIAGIRRAEAIRGRLAWPSL